MPRAKDRRLCVKCGIEKPISFFEQRSDTGGHRNACRKCLNSYRTERWRIRNQAKYDAVVAFQEKYPGQKQCIKCGDIKDLERFALHKTATDGRRNTCKKCYNIYAQNKRKEKTGQLREYNLMRDHGITQVEYLELLDSQSGKCHICNRDTPSTNPRIKHFSIDHCHKTGKIRALLCNNCNTGIGRFRDDPSLIEKAVKYLKMFE